MDDEEKIKFEPYSEVLRVWKGLIPGLDGSRYVYKGDGHVASK